MTEISEQLPDTSSTDPQINAALKDEMYPIGSFLISRRLRPYIMAYYKCGRIGDDIADSPDMPKKQKLKLLKAMKKVLLEGKGDKTIENATAFTLRKSMLERDLDLLHISNIFDAFIQDCKKNRYNTWAELIDYADKSTAPVGRFLLELHGEDRTLFRKNDALCRAIQVINHVRDCKKDFINLDRSYLPGMWLAAAGVTASDVTSDKASPGLRAVIDKCMSATRVLLDEAIDLPTGMFSTRLSMEVSIIINVAYGMVEELEKRDPLAEKVSLSRFQFVSCFVKGIMQGLRRKRATGFVSVPEVNDHGE